MLSGLLPKSDDAFSVHRDLGRQESWPTLLIADPDEEMNRTLVTFFEKRGFHAASANSVSDVQELFHRRKAWTLIIADYHLPDGTGMELCDWIRDQMCDAPILLLSGSPHSATLCAGADYLPKPFALERLEAYVRGIQRR